MIEMNASLNPSRSSSFDGMITTTSDSFLEIGRTVEFTHAELNQDVGTFSVLLSVTFTLLE